MALEMTPEETKRDDEIIRAVTSDDSDSETDLRAFCERWKPFKGENMQLWCGSFKESALCGCMLCRMYCKIRLLVRLGPDIWRMDQEERKKRLLGFGNRLPLDRRWHYYGSGVWAINNTPKHELQCYIKFFLTEDMRMQRLPMDAKLIANLLRYSRLFLERRTYSGTAP